jgi:hypothetical protein
MKLQFDFILLVLLYIVPSIVCWIAIIRASESGNWYWHESQGTKKVVSSSNNIPIPELALFKFWVVGTIFYAIIFTVIALDHWEVWFPKA